MWDREGAIHCGGGRPTTEFAVFCGQLGVGWVILEPRIRRRRESASDRIGSCARTSSRAGGSRTTWTSRSSSTGWCNRVNQRVHRTIQAVPRVRLVAVAWPRAPATALCVRGTTPALVPGLRHGAGGQAVLGEYGVGFGQGTRCLFGDVGGHCLPGGVGVARGERLDHWGVPVDERSVGPKVEEVNALSLIQ